MAAPKQLRQPLAYSVTGAAEAIGISPSKLEEVIKRCDISVKWIDGKRVIEASELLAYLDALPIERAS
ncbi:hypothetical protein ASC66_01060 [Leifsonia sp. Root4]|uniref:transcriptional regulator n=1 Tax=Leifsonia sp. Root4 TaxID=1736525 RepID=UPI000701F85E|nr:transcriptional regulator [Leifsonia sp. Root4]KQW07618.1 hypothetical protein ASC66_01060 [Leifsonia sp. Root4]